MSIVCDSRYVAVLAGSADPTSRRLILQIRGLGGVFSTPCDLCDRQCYIRRAHGRCIKCNFSSFLSKLFLKCINCGGIRCA